MAADGTREVRLVVRNMTFYLEGAGAANPTLRLRAGGDLSRLVLRNEDRGMKHDLIGAGAGMRRRRSSQASARRSRCRSRRPREALARRTHCTPHEETMRGNDNRRMKPPTARLARDAGIESAATSAASFTPSPIATTSSPACCRTGRIGAGSGGSSTWPAPVRHGALDLACGTGDIAFGLAARGARVAGLDITPRMLQLRAREAAAGARPCLRRRRHDGAAVPDARSISSRRATASATCRIEPRSPRSAACCARAGGSCRSTSTGRRTRSSAASTWATSRWSAPRSAGRCTAIPTPTATSRVDPALSRRPGVAAMLARAGFARLPGHSPAWVG